jgi:hypothetical protein
VRIDNANPYSGPRYRREHSTRKDIGKAYGSMVVYVTKGSEARRLLDGYYFHLAGESAYTTIFTPREGPTQCYRRPEIGHKAFALYNHYNHSTTPISHILQYPCVGKSRGCRIRQGKGVYSTWLAGWWCAGDFGIRCFDAGTRP